MTDEKKQFKGVYDVLHYLQTNLIAPKNQYNNFGKYKYRSVEDIQEGVKKILPECASLIVSDGIEEVGGRVYVKATACLNYKGSNVECSAYAREPIAQKGMTDSQVTGSASSYARKYALGGLLIVDDQKDSDAEKPQESKPVEQKLDDDEMKLLSDGIESATNVDELKAAFDNVNAARERMSKAQLAVLTTAKDMMKKKLLGASNGTN